MGMFNLLGARENGERSNSRVILTLALLFVMACYGVAFYGMIRGTVGWESTPAAYLSAGTETQFVPAVRGVGKILESLVGFLFVTALPYMTNKVSGAIQKNRNE